MGSEAARPPGGETGGRNQALVLVLAVIWIAFVVFSLAVVLDFGFVGFIEAAVEDGAAAQISIDLIISLVIALSFIRVDARRRNLPYWPYVVATAASGSIGLIAYLIHRAWRAHGR